jgi:CheY-like chemotaxis protein
MKVLIADDEADFRDALKDALQDEGYQVVTAADGAGALEILNRDELPCVFILDLLMPAMTGVEVYTRMQSDPRLARVPVIVTTSDPRDAPSGVMIMRKPINLERLLAAVQTHCSHPH